MKNIAISIKKIFIIFISFFICLSSFGEETNTVQKPSPWGFYFSSNIIINKPDNENKTIPAAVSLSAGTEYEYEFAKYLMVNPSLDISVFHYLWTGSAAALSEPENRTALVFLTKAELPLSFVFKTGNWTFTTGAGIAFFIRFGVLDMGVKPGDRGRVGLTAKEEIKFINKHFWKDARWLYPSMRFKTEYTFASGWKTGAMINIYLPLFNAWAKPKTPFSNELMLQLGIILHPVKKNKS